MDSTADKVSIANLACIKMGVKTITAFDDGTESARVIGLTYDFCRNFVLEEHPWTFAESTVALATLSYTPVDFSDGVSIAYALPSDYLSLRAVNFPSAVIQQEKLTTGAIALLSDTPGLKIKYTFKNDDPTTYTAKFIDALACMIAKQCCFKLVEGNQNSTKLEADYSKAIMTAIADDSKTSTPEQPYQDEWFIARLSGSSVVVGNPDGRIGYLGPGFGSFF
jgi:hypothetical protein